MKTADPGHHVAECLRVVRDELRAGRSLRTAILRASDVPASPLAAVRRELRSGRPIDVVLATAATRATSPEAACALCVLQVQAETGGDPVPAVRSLEERLRIRVSAARHARALTAHARLSARTMMLLTPGFLALLVALDPSGTLRSLSVPATRVAVGGGLVLQLLGSFWIARIVRGTHASGSSGAASRLPVLRAVVVLTGGARRADSVGDEVADAADALALVLEAGLSPGRGLGVVAASLPGRFGDVLREANRRVRAGATTTDALRACVAPLGPDARRFVSAFADSERLGVPLAATLRGLADDVRDASTARLEEDVRRASVRVLIPLGLLILPAFVLSCLVPLLIGGLGGLPL